METKTFEKRLSYLQQSLKDNQIFLLSTPNDITYFTGLNFLVPEEREALLLVSKNKVMLIQVSFSPFIPDSFITDLRNCSPQSLKNHLTKEWGENKNTQVFIDTESLFVNEYQALKSLEFIEILPLDRKTIWQQRMVKDSVELSAVKEASRIASEAWKKLEPQIKTGLSELEIKIELEKILIELGSSKTAFPTIVAFGKSSALPHHQPTKTKLKNNQVVLVDFGATVDGYRSDVTRTIWVGEKPSAKFSEIEKIIHLAYDSALTLLNDRAKDKVIKALSIDNASRQVIKNAGYGKEFIHTTGHGVGLDIHEAPSLNWQNQTEIKTGMVLTIEPGIYLEGEFGYRYENTVVVTEEGVEVLT